MRLCHAMCNYCGNVEETCLHVLRDCELVKHMWLIIVPLEPRDLFFGGNLFHWMQYNLRSDISCPLGGLLGNGLSLFVDVAQ
jgi:hypothetical protein